jgi:membrane protease YdiL (CAAX protease family)
MADLSWEAKLTVSIGAGIYEELVFRLMGIVLLYGLFVDMIGMGKITGSALAILLSSVAFAQAHFLPGTPFRWNLYLFFCLAGVYLAGVYIARGFGIAAGAHALYDVIVVALSSMEPAAG